MAKKLADNLYVPYLLSAQRGRSQTTLIKQGRYVVIEMSTIYRFSLNTVKAFLHRRQPGVGSYSKKDQNFDNVVKERPQRPKNIMIKVGGCVRDRGRCAIVAALFSPTAS